MFPLKARIIEWGGFFLSPKNNFQCDHSGKKTCAENCPSMLSSLYLLWYRQKARDARIAEKAGYFSSHPRRCVQPRLEIDRKSGISGRERKRAKLYGCRQQRCWRPATTASLLQKNKARVRTVFREDVSAIAAESSSPRTSPPRFLLALWPTSCPPPGREATKSPPVEKGSMSPVAPPAFRATKTTWRSRDIRQPTRGAT